MRYFDWRKRSLYEKRKLNEKKIRIYKIRNNAYANVRKKYIQNTVYCISKYLKNAYAIEKIVTNAAKFTIEIGESKQ